MSSINRRAPVGAARAGARPRPKGSTRKKEDKTPGLNAIEHLLTPFSERDREILVSNTRRVMKRRARMEELLLKALKQGEIKDPNAEDFMEIRSSTEERERRHWERMRKLIIQRSRLYRANPTISRAQDLHYVKRLFRMFRKNMTSTISMPSKEVEETSDGVGQSQNSSQPSDVSKGSNKSEGVTPDTPCVKKQAPVKGAMEKTNPAQTKANSASDSEGTDKEEIKRKRDDHNAEDRPAKRSKSPEVDKTSKSSRAEDRSAKKDQSPDVKKASQSPSAEDRSAEKSQTADVEKVSQSHSTEDGHAKKSQSSGAEKASQSPSTEDGHSKKSKSPDIEKAPQSTSDEAHGQADTSTSNNAGSSPAMTSEKVSSPKPEPPQSSYSVDNKEKPTQKTDKNITSNDKADKVDQKLTPSEGHNIKPRKSDKASIQEDSQKKSAGKVATVSEKPSKFEEDVQDDISVTSTEIDPLEDSEDDSLEREFHDQVVYDMVRNPLTFNDFVSDGDKPAFMNYSWVRGGMNPAWSATYDATVGDPPRLEASGKPIDNTIKAIQKDLFGGMVDISDSDIIARLDLAETIVPLETDAELIEPFWPDGIPDDELPFSIWDFDRWDSDSVPQIPRKSIKSKPSKKR
jgi:hypothetical protein